MRMIPVFLLLALCGCLANNTLGTTTRADLNIYHIDKVHKGMTDEQVFQVMSYPDKQAVFETDQGEYQVWYYVTRGTVMDQSRLLPRNLTPLVFKDGVLVGRGYDYVHWLADKQKNRGNETQVPGPAQSPENVPLEKSLTPGTGPQTKSPNKPTTMSNRPSKQPEPSPEEDDESSEETEKRKGPPPFNKEEKRMQREEEEEDFDYW